MNTKLLPPYYNPSFQSPMRTHSPKRKRNDARSYTPPARSGLSRSRSLSLKTDSITLQPATESSSPGAANSPRMKVTQQFNDLKIDAAEAREKERIPVTPRKKIKRSSTDEKSADVLDGADIENPDAAPETFPSNREIEETPGCHHVRQEDPNEKLPSRLSTTARTPLTDETSDQQPRTPSPSPPPKATTTTSSRPSPPPRPTSPSTNLSADQASFTWRSDEITGHEIDPSTDDDGEGINGIGFKPTPAIAYWRKQRRSQQVTDWKAREAREARQRRFERRGAAPGGAGGFDGPGGPGGPGGAGSGDEGMVSGFGEGSRVKRVVRFVGLD